MTELFDCDAETCFIPAEMAQGENLAEILLPVFCSQANTEGGTVIIGAARAPDGSVFVEGLPSISETRLLIEELIEDKSRISVNTINAMNIIRKNGKDILKIEVAPAPWTERPVYINSDPEYGVYHYFDGRSIVLRKNIASMMAKDSVDIHRDDKRLELFYESSIDLEALERYRKFYSEKHRLSKWDLLDNDSFMERIGAKSEGRLLRAGFLMFGEN
ncbi:MAG: ATP-binding protein, partial [Synergistaceae bacterium]|nr:ATP-binding protein [Synergistaceae bacterium]